MTRYPGIVPTDIYLPAFENAGKWAVIACDQYTSQPEYWEALSTQVGSAPSALNIVLPEVYLSETDKRLPEIRSSMEKYVREGALTKQVENGFVLTKRVTFSGVRPGLVAAVDLAAYDYMPGSGSLIRATEGTILERIPPRVKIREGALLECPHIMLLIDDPGCTVIEPLLKQCENDAPLYDCELMQGGGHLTGWRVSGDTPSLATALEKLETSGKGFLYAVGDGNHSLATAKACWSGKDDATRYALVEIVNLHCPALRFEPIHRVLFGVSSQELLDDFKASMQSKGLNAVSGSAIKFIDAGSESGISVENAGNVLDVTLVQPWLDAFLKSHPEVRVDYVHGEGAVRALCSNGAAGILLGTIDKAALFPSVRKNGVLPRKSFSMGEADEKRFYMEARLIR